MRVQTSFEKMSQLTNGSIFTFCLVAIRLLLGASSLYLAISAVQSWPAVGNLPTLSMSWAMTLFCVVAAALGVSFLIGLLIRLVALLAIAILILLFILDGHWDTMGDIVPQIGLILLLGLYAAGGAGHIFGLDGIIYRNLRRPGRLVKFLFG